MTQLRRYLTPAEAAAQLGVSADTIRRRIRSGELPAIRVSPRVIRIPVPAFELFRTGRQLRRRLVIHRRVDALPAIGADEGLSDEASHG